MADRLVGEAELSIASLEESARWLAQLTGDRPVHRVLDLGSGPGVEACVLAAAFPDAVTEAVDGSARLLALAAERATGLGVGDRFVTSERQLPDGLDSLEPADVVVSSRVVHHLGDQAAAIRRIAALVRPGGLLAISEGGLPQRTLPRDIGVGRPGLEARIDVALQDWFGEMRAAQPDAVATVEHWPGILAGAGLVPCGSRSFLTDLPAPLDERARAVVTARWGGVRDRVQEVLAADDLGTLDRLLDPDDPAGLQRRDDLYLLTASTVHVARVRG
ncbi:MAG: methyltransferase domain-containing protein [Streptosporangiales bacterium]|nr:methyltransferase domain-containing protein [Streptosporangiales bacterium]